MNGELDICVKRAGFIQSTTGPRLYTKITERGPGLQPHICHMCIYVDDMIVATTPKNPDYDGGGGLLVHIDRVFKRAGGGPVDFFLGWGITRDRKNRRLRTDQKQMIRDTIAPPPGSPPPLKAPTILTTKFIASKLDCPQTDADKRKYKAAAERYRTTLGKMLYVARCTRPDILPALSVLGRYTSNPGPNHTKAMRHLGWYLHNTIDKCLDYRPPHAEPVNVLTAYEKHLNPGASNDHILVGYVDADWAGDRDTRRPQGGGIMMLNCSPVAWFPKKQPVVAMSTMESELISLTAGALLIVYLRNLLSGLDVPQTQATVMNGGNKATITVAHNRSINKAARHIAIRHFKVKELIADGTIVCSYCPSFENKADIMTKNVDSNTLDRHVSTMLGTI